MEQQPLVSVIIPTYSRPDNIVRAIDSVLAQTYKNIEIIVVDDNGEGTPYQIETEKVLREYIDNGKITYIKHEVNKNGSAARNTGFRASHGEYVNFLDDDDLFFSNKVLKQVSCLLSTDDCIGGAYCNMEYVRKQNITGRYLNSITNNDISGNILKEYLLNTCFFNTSSILFKKATIINLKGFDESYRRHQDLELMVRFFRNYKILCSGSEVLLRYDTTSDRNNMPDSKNCFELENRFLYEFEDDLKRINAYKEVASFLWYGCMFKCCLANDIPTFNKSYKRFIENGSLSLMQFIKLFIALLYGLKNRLI